MLDLARYDRLKLSAKPFWQRFIATIGLMPNFRLPPRVRIRLEGRENLPSEPVIFAMNHTDRYNYWPFQYQLWRKVGRFTATWVKGKYYENPWLGRFMDLTNNIPTPSRGYLVTKDFIATLGERPKPEQYRALRDWVDAAAGGRQPDAPAPIGLPRDLFERRRDVFGRAFEPQSESYAAYINAVFDTMTQRFRALNEAAFDMGLDLLVFPQGTRSVRLSRGRGGLAQLALRYQKPIVPVGCNGSDKVYPGASPIAKGGRIVYRFGPPITVEEMAPFRPSEPFEAFTGDAETRFGETFQALTDLVMDRINALLDPPYQYADDAEDDGTRDTKRFV